jgi:CHAT domain-containing protein
LFKGQPSGLSQQRQTLPADTALIVFSAPMDTALHVFVLTRSAERVYRSPLPPREVWNLVRRFRATMDTHGQAPADLEVLERLYAALIAPIEPAIENTSRLLVLPTRSLHYVPVQALVRRTPRGSRFLVEDKEIVYFAPANQDERRAVTPIRVTALANPTGDLPSTETEAQQIKNVLPNTVVHTGDAATKRALGDAVEQRSTVLHLAAHGYLIPHAPTMSYLAMAGPSLEDRRLTVSEIRGLPLDGVRLITLSACDAAMAQADPRGVELATMSDAFMTAGASAVVGTLWKVPDDERTVGLMTRFYRALASGMCEAAALRTAQIESLAAASNPYGWASFVLFGHSSGQPCRTGADTPLRTDADLKVRATYEPEWRR